MSFRASVNREVCWRYLASHWEDTFKNMRFMVSAPNAFKEDQCDCVCDVEGILPEDVNIAFFERGPHDVVAEDGATHEEIYSEVRNIKVGADGSLSEYPTDFLDEWNIQQLRLFSGRKA